MEKLDQVALFNIATMLDLDNLLSFCSSDSRINRLICQQDAIWLFKLSREFPDWKRLDVDISLKDIYILLNNLTRLKEKIKFEGSIYDLYTVKNLTVEILPKEIGLLINLESLILRNFKVLPKEIGLLTNLKLLDASLNNITMLPKEIGDMINLEILNLDGNQIKILPKEITRLINLKILKLEGNRLASLPNEILNMEKLEKIYLGGNPIMFPWKSSDMKYGYKIHLY